MSEQGPVDHFTIIPRRFTDAWLAAELDHLHVLIGLHIAERCYEVRNTAGGVASIRLSLLAELCGDVSTETIRSKLHDLEPAWIVCDVRQGQRSAWKIRLTGLAQESLTDRPLPDDFQTTSRETPPPVWKLTSTAPDAGETAIPLGERDASATRLPHRVSERQDKRNETKRNDNERKAGNEEKLDTAVGETTAADPFDAIKRARRFDEMFPPRRRIMSDPLPQLLDARHLAAELGVTRAAAEKMMQSLPIVQMPGLRKVYVRRSDVERLLEACTFQKDQVPA